MTAAAYFLEGAIFAGFCVIGLFFCRFWRKTGDTLFAYFAAAFWILAVERGLLIRYGLTSSRDVAVYLVRLLAFILIIIAIAAKNRHSSSR